MLIKNARLSFPNLFKPAAFSPGQTEKFNATFILRKEDPQLALIQAEIKKLVTATWKQPPAGLKLCLRDGTEKAYEGFGEEIVFFNASSDVRPTAVDRDNSELTAMDGRLYAGCYVNAIVDFWAQNNQYGKRVNAQLRGVQFMADGDRFGGGSAPAAADDFPPLDDEDAFEPPKRSAQAAPLSEEAEWLL